MGGLSSYRTQRLSQLAMYMYISLEEELGPCLITELLFLDYFPFFSLHPLISLIHNCLNLLFGIQKRSKKLKAFFYKQETGGMEGLLYPAGFYSVSIPAPF